MKVIKPQPCLNLGYEDICLSLCVPCKNPYHCTYHPANMKRLVRTCKDVYYIALRSHTEIDCSEIRSCNVCRYRPSCWMHLIAFDMIIGGEY